MRIAVVFAVAFGVGIAVKAIFDSRSAGAVAWILMFMGFTVLSLVRRLSQRPELFVPILVCAGAGSLASSIIVAVEGAVVLVPVFLLLGTVAVMYAKARSRAH